MFTTALPLLWYVTTAISRCNDIYLNIEIHINISIFRFLFYSFLFFSILRNTSITFSSPVSNILSSSSSRFKSVVQVTEEREFLRYQRDLYSVDLSYVEYYYYLILILLSLSVYLYSFLSFNQRISISYQ